MIPQPVVSIVIPYLSGYEYLKKCLASVKKQKVKKEIIVVNDSGKKLILKDVRIINNGSTKGVAYSRNVGFKKAFSKIVMFVDNDITLEKDSIAKMLSGIKDSDISFPKIVYENKRVMHPIGEEKNFPQISACFMIKKSSVSKMDELFDKNYFIYLEDADFFLRANLFGLKSKYVEKALAIHKLKEEINEKRFYLETKNLYYGFVKFYNIKKKHILHPFKISSIISNYLCALFNFDKFDFSHYDRSLNKFQKLILLFRKHRRITRRNRFILIYNVYKIEFNSFFHMNIPLRKRKQLIIQK